MTRLRPAHALVILAVLFSGCGGGDTDPTREPFLQSLPPADWTPEDAGLLFMSSRSGNAEIYFRAAGDTTWVNLTRNEASDNWGEWSPDGSRIAFHSDRNGRLDIFVMQADGSDVVQVTSDEDHDYLPDWTPDGRLLFTSWRQEATDSVRAQHVYIVRPDGSGEQRLDLAGGASVVGATYAPDGRSIVYGREGEGRSSDLWLASDEDRVGRKLTDGQAFYGAPRFSPDGKLLAYYADSGTQSDILVQDLATGAVDTVLTGGKHWYPRWSPDGRWMLTCSERGHGNFDVLAVPVDGSMEPMTLVSGSPRDCEGRWPPAGAGRVPAAP